MELDEFAILNSDWTLAGTSQEITTYLYNSGAPTTNEQYPYITYTATYAIGGNVTLGGSATQGATLRLHEQTNNLYIGDTTTDVNGDYEFDNLIDGNEYHVSVEYESGGTKYNDESKPFVTPYQKS
jgi:hypothetical protein